MRDTLCDMFDMCSGPIDPAARAASGKPVMCEKNVLGHLLFDQVFVGHDKRRIAVNAAGQWTAPIFEGNEHIHHLQLVKDRVPADKYDVTPGRIDVSAEVYTGACGLMQSRGLLMLEVHAIKAERSQPPAQPPEGRSGQESQFSVHGL
jgi:hypothetical protein